VAPSLRWSPQSRADMLDVYVAIAVEQPAAAERYLDRIEAKVAMLRERPRLGVRRPDIRRGVRMLVEAPIRDPL
jgi:toxin ParE1/3/4